MQPRSGRPKLLRDRVAPGVFVLEGLVEILALRDRDRGAGAQQIEYVFAAHAVGGAAVAVPRGFDIGRCEELKNAAVEREVLAAVFEEARDRMLFAACEVGVGYEAAFVRQRLCRAER